VEKGTTSIRRKKRSPSDKKIRFDPHRGEPYERIERISRRPSKPGSAGGGGGSKEGPTGWAGKISWEPCQTKDYVVELPHRNDSGSTRKGPEGKDDAGVRKQKNREELGFFCRGEHEPKNQIIWLKNEKHKTKEGLPQLT